MSGFVVQGPKLDNRDSLKMDFSLFFTGGVVLSSRFVKPKDELYNFITLQYLLLWEQMCHHPQSLAELFSFTLISLHFSMYRNLSCTRVTSFYFYGKVMTTDVGIFCNVVFLPRNQSFMMSNTSRYTM